MRRSIGILTINISVALYLAATGIMGFMQKSFFSGYNGEIRRAVSAFLDGNLAETVIVVLSIVALTTGVLILVRLFNTRIPIIDLLLVILAVVWIVFIIMIDFVYPLNSRVKLNFVEWLLGFSSHLMVLGGIALSTNRFGA